MSYDQNIDDGPLMVHFDPGNLSDLAAVSFAAALMHDKITKQRQYPEKYFDFHSADLDGISLPQSIKDTVVELLEYDMVTTRTQWWAYHYENVFLKRLPADTMIDWLDQLVWLPKGSIDYRQTAKKLMNDDRLTNVQKLQLACSYCFVEDVELLKNTLTNEEINEAIGGSQVFEDEISRYWCKRLHIGPFFRLFVNNRARFFDRLISSFKHYDEWSFFEYFLNQLNNEERLRKANSIIDLGKANFTWNLLPLLTGPELDSVIREKSRKIIMTLVETRRCLFFENILLIWKRMMHVIDNDALVDILIQVNELDYDRSYVNAILWEMWLDTTERQKKFIVDERVCDFVENPDNHENLYYHPNFPLIIDLLSRSSPERRYEYFTAHWPFLVLGQLDERSSIDRIMKMCIGNDHQIETFKNNVMLNYDSISKDCEYLISLGGIDEVSTFVDFCTTDPQVNRDFKRMIITKMPKTIFDYLIERLDDSMIYFNQYIENCFTAEESKEFFNGIVTHPDNLQKMQELLPSQFQRVVKFVEKYVSDEKNLLNVKLHFLKNCRSDDGIPNSAMFDLATWCFKGDNTETKKLKRLLPRARRSVAGVQPVPVSKNPVFDTLMETYLE